MTSFWKAMQSTSWLSKHPVKDKPGFNSKAVPIRIFGDGVAVLGLSNAWGRSVECIMVGSYLNESNSKLANVICTLVWKKKRVPRTMEKVWSILRWSLESLYSRKHPSRNWQGHPWPAGSWEASMAGLDLADGYYGVVAVSTPVVAPIEKVACKAQRIDSIDARNMWKIMSVFRGRGQ